MTSAALLRDIAPKTAVMLGCIEHRELWGRSALGRVMTQAEMPPGVLLVQSTDGALWSWPVCFELLRERHR